MPDAIALSLFHFESLSARAWALGQMLAARPRLRRLEGLRFLKMFGTGTGEGFDPRPNTGVFALMTVWDDLEMARAQVGGAPVIAGYRDHAAEHGDIFLSTLTSRGAWDGRAPFRPGADRAPGAPIAVLTRATLRSSGLLGFWRHVPAIEAKIRAVAPEILVKIGMGEVPWMRQVTFTIWRDADAMTAFAHGPGPHREAVMAVRRGGWFREELYARFAVVAADGSWEGMPLAPRLMTPAAPEARPAA